MTSAGLVFSPPAAFTITSYDEAPDAAAYSVFMGVSPASFSQPSIPLSLESQTSISAFH